MTLRSGEVYFSEQKDSFVIPETISVFGFSISFYGLLLVLGVLLGIVVAVKETRRKQQDVEQTLTLITVVILSGIVGARLYYVMFHWQVFAEHPIALLNFRGGGLAYYGAVLAAWLTGKQWCKRKKVVFEQYADILGMGAAATTPLVWLGCAFVREPVGRFYDGMFSVRFASTDTPTHPVALYGAVISIVVFFVSFFLKGRMKQPGNLFTLYLLLNAFSSFVLEFFRADRCCVWGTKVPANCVMATILVAAIGIDGIRRHKANKNSKGLFTNKK